MMKPCSASLAVSRTLALLTDPSNATHGYALGTGDYRPQNGVDLPWTERERDHTVGSDCAFAITYSYMLRRHMPGFNKGGKFNVEDDINYNSAIGDALGAAQCFVIATGDPQPGDIVCYPTFRLPGVPQPFIGHGAIVVDVSRVTSANPWDPTRPRYDLLDVVQCKGPDGRKPAMIRTDGSIWLHHAEQWPKPEHTVYLLRAVA